MTISLQELRLRRDIAGKRYAEALAELREAKIGLAAIDAALASEHSGLPAQDRPVRTFHGEGDSIPEAFRHPVYAPDALGGMNDAAHAKRDEYTARIADH